MHRKALQSVRVSLGGPEHLSPRERRNNTVQCTRGKLVAVSLGMLLTGALFGLYAKSLTDAAQNARYSSAAEKLRSTGMRMSYTTKAYSQESSTSIAEALADVSGSAGQQAAVQQRGKGADGQQESSSAALDRAKASTERAVVEDAIQTARKGAAQQAVHVQFPWDSQAEFDTVTVCDDSCPAAGDGVCDDGRGLPLAPSIMLQVRCDLGTDCSDCGAFTHHLHRQPNSTLPQPHVPQPVKMLTKRGIQVLVRNTTVEPFILMPFTDPAKDVDVSGQMSAWGVVEMGITHVWWHVLGPVGGGCRKAGGKRGLVMDVGANFGYYTLYAAAMGCRVIAWEPVPHFRAFLEYAVALNNFTGLVEIRSAAVADKSGEQYTLTVPQRGIWGTASVNGGNIDKSIDNQGDYEKVTVSGERADAVVQEDVALLKLDVEGFEPQAFASSKGILDGHSVDNILIEYSPGIYDANLRWSEAPDWPKMLSYLLEHGFTLHHLEDAYVRQPANGSSLVNRLLPHFEEVTAENLKHDLDDARKLQSRTLGCTHVPAELKTKYPAWVGCNGLPEDLHPKSLRCMFGHNTNIWGTTDRAKARVGGTVGIMSQEQSMAEWYGKNPLLGMGGRLCASVPDSVKVRHRCSCTNATVCAEEAQLVEKFAKMGLIRPDDASKLTAYEASLSSQQQ